MSPLTEPNASQALWEAPEALPLDPAVWLAWKRKGSVHDQAVRARGLMATKIISATTLLLTAAMWSQAAPYGIWVQFIVTLGAVVLMGRALKARQYLAAFVFGLLFLLYNPLLTLITFSGDLPKALVFASAIPFAASLLWGKERLVL